MTASPGPETARVVGVDFDNTLVSYDELMWEVARERELIAADVPRHKRAVRDHIRRRPDGDLDWQRVQAIAYGPRIKDARLIDGVPGFFAACRRAGVRVCVVSHKTTFSSIGDEAVNLRAAAAAWMADHGFFAPHGLGLREEDVYYEASRPEKAARIAALRCLYFVDDLEETFAEPTFPADVERILFVPDGAAPPSAGLVVCRSWDEITRRVFDARA